MDDNNFLIYAGAAILSWVIFYYTIKAAVSNGIQAAKKDEKFFADNNKVISPERVALQKKYVSGELSKEEYDQRLSEIK